MGAERELQRAIELNRSDAQAYLRYAGFLLERKRLDEALDQSQQAREFDPFSIESNLMTGRILIELQLYDRAIQQLEKTEDLDRNFAPARYYLGRAYQARGMFSDSIREFQKAIFAAGPNPAFVAALGETYAASGRMDEARAQLNELRRMALSRQVSQELLDELQSKIR